MAKRKVKGRGALKATPREWRVAPEFPPGCCCATCKVYGEPGDANDRVVSIFDGRCYLNPRPVDKHRNDSCGQWRITDEEYSRP